MREIEWGTREWKKITIGYEWEETVMRTKRGTKYKGRTDRVVSGGDVKELAGIVNLISKLWRREFVGNKRYI